MKTDFFQSCGHCWDFQICWHIECSNLTASSFRIWNSSIGFLSPPLALLAVMLPKAHLTSHSRVSGSRWTTTPSLVIQVIKTFLYGSSVLFLMVLFLISSASPYHSYTFRSIWPPRGRERMSRHPGSWLHWSHILHFSRYHIWWLHDPHLTAREAGKWRGRCRDLGVLGHIQPLVQCLAHLSQPLEK